MGEIPNIKFMFEDKEFPNPESEDIKLSPKQSAENPNTYQSPFSNFCMNSLSPIPFNQKISSPINLNAEGTPKFHWRSVVNPSPLKDEKLETFNFKTSSSRFIQKLDFAQLPSNNVQFQASLVNVKVNLATYSRTNNEREETARTKVKKRNREEEIEIVKPVSCKCQRSKCLKLYCDCFSSGQYCTDCSCVGCANLPEFESLRVEAISSTLERNPEAFKPKIKSTSISSQLAEHNRGCNCKKSACLKKYCECYQSGIPCSSKCKCHGCRNKDEGKKKQKHSR